MKKVEILAPAGNMESLHAAIMGGCDAVYLGGYMFGARSFAGNFSNEEIIEAIELAHLYGVRVYVTVNTIIYESEVEMFLDYIDFLHKNHVDAVIVQDLGMMDLLKDIYPNLEIHASTQMHIHNLESASFVEKLGLKRCVLARETSIDEIRKIKEQTKIELEIFIHGALCISYSGQCLMSKMIGGRSGNRGSCAGSCRLPYTLIEEVDGREVKKNYGDYVLSMKDLNTLEHLEQLLRIGVDSLKIEGRMKRPEYVYLVTSIYRHAVDSFYKYGKVIFNQKDIYELEKIYHRYFTKGFLFQEKNDNLTNDYRPNHMGVPIGKVIDFKYPRVSIRLTEKVSIHDGIRIFGEREDHGFTLNEFYKNKKLVKEAYPKDVIEINVKGCPKIGSLVVKTTDVFQLKQIKEKWINCPRKVSIQGVLKCSIGKPLKLSVTDGFHHITILSDNKVEIAKNHPITKEEMMRQMDRLKDTCYEWDKLEVKIKGNVFLTKSSLNKIRRDMVEKLNRVRLERNEYKKEIYHLEIPELHQTSLNTYYVETLEQYNKIKENKVDVIYVNNRNLYEQLKKDTRVMMRLERALTTYDKFENVMVSEVGGVSLCKNYVTDTSLNVVNSYTLAFLYKYGARRVTLSYELDYDQIKEMLDAFFTRYHKKANVEVVINGHPEILISKVDLLNKYKIKGNHVYLKDRKGKKYRVKKLNGLTHIYHSEQINLDKQRLLDIGVTNFCKHF